MHTRDKIKTATIKRKSPILMDSYRQIRNKVNLLNKPLKSRIALTRFPPIRGNFKDSLKTIDKLLNKGTKLCYIDCLKDSDNVVLLRAQMTLLTK